MVQRYGQTDFLGDVERNLRSTTSSSNPKALPPEPPRLDHHCVVGVLWITGIPTIFFAIHILPWLRPPCVSPKAPRLTTHKMRLRTSTVGIPPKGCP